MSTTSILLVEDHKVFAQALLHILSSMQDLEVVAIAESAEQAIELLRDLKVDLVLADVSLPHMSGISLVKKLREQHPDLRCAVLSGHVSPEYIQSALDAGARGYLFKDSPHGIREGIPRILNGEVYISKEGSFNSD